MQKKNTKRNIPGRKIDWKNYVTVLTKWKIILFKCFIELFKVGEDQASEQMKKKRVN